MKTLTTKITRVTLVRFERVVYSFAAICCRLQKKHKPCLWIIPPCMILATIHLPSSFSLRVIP